MAVVYGGALVLPLLAAGGVLFDGYCRHLFLHESQPKQRAIQGASLAAAAAAAAAHFGPPAAALPAEDLWSALLSSPAVSSLGLVGLGLLVTEAVSHAQMLTQLRDLATLYAAEAALFGSLAALAVAALGSCLRFELNQLRHRLFNTPCVFLLAGVGAASLHMQGRRLRSAYAVGERNAVSRAHAIALMLTAPLVIAAVLTGGPNSSSSEGGGGVAALGFAGWFDALGFFLTVALSVLSLTMVYKPPRSSSSSSTPYGAPKLDVDPQLAALLGSATAHQRQVSPSSMASTPHLQQQQLLVAGADGKYRIASSPVVTGRSSRSAASSQKPKPSQQQMVSAGGGVGGGGVCLQYPLSTSRHCPHQCAHAPLPIPRCSRSREEARRSRSRYLLDGVCWRIKTMCVKVR